MVIELLPKYIMGDKELCFEIEECLVNGNLTFPDDHEIPNLKKVKLGLEKIPNLADII